MHPDAPTTGEEPAAEKWQEASRSLRHPSEENRIPGVLIENSDRIPGIFSSK